MDILKIDSLICDYYSETKEDKEKAHIVVGWCHDNSCECSEVPFDECITKAVEYCKLKDRQLKQIRDLYHDTCKCKHLVLGECSSTGKNCIGIKRCLHKHRQILQEIREILLFHEKELDECLHNDIDGQILQKISEVLHVEND